MNHALHTLAMNYAIHTLNHWGEPALGLAWTMLWQSSVLIVFLFGLDYVCRRKVRASVRYALWLVVLVKLALPPSLALPTGLGWWLRPAVAAPSRPRQLPVVITYGPVLAPRPLSSAGVTPAPPPPARLSPAAWGLTVAVAVSVGLLAWMVVRWRQVATVAGRAALPAGWLEELVEQARRAAGLRRPVRLRLSEQPLSPAVCGLVRPVVLLPRALAERLRPDQMRAVLVHELVHLRRGDAWCNLCQALLQILYWWHPLLWLANARIRRTREEAVDDAVMLALEEGADMYAPTLLQVARLALRRPLASLGLVGILESRSFLGQRIERLLDFHPPRQAGLTLASVCSVLAFAALAVPMGQAPASAAKPEAAAVGPASSTGTDQAALGAGDMPRAEATNGAAAEFKRQNEELMAKSENKMPGEGVEAPAAGAMTAKNWADRLGLMYTGRGRQVIVSKLDRIRLDEVGPWQNVPLSEVIRTLSEQVLNRDPQGQGINFVINPILATGAGTSAPGAIGPGTAETVDMNAVRVKMEAALRDVRLADVLDAIIKMADTPIKYSVEDYGVVFSPRGHEATPLYFRTFKLDAGALEGNLQLYLRTFKVDANALEENLRKFQVPTEGTNRGAITVSGLRGFFAQHGVDVSPPKSLYYKDREGTLLVYASLAELDTIERAIQVPNRAAPEINIEAVFIELSKPETEAFWAESSPTNRPGPEGGPVIATLTRFEAAARLRRWESLGGSNIFGRVQVTTLSGRQAKVSVALKPITTVGTMGQTNTAPPLLSPGLELTPAVTPDGNSVQMDMNVTVLEFIGYDDPGPFAQMAPAAATNAGAVPAAVQPLPHFRFRSVPTSVKVRDGQTVVLGGLLSDNVSKLKDQVPNLSDIPIIGRLFRNEMSQTEKKDVLIFVTPTIIDAAGNRIHRDKKE